MTTQNLVPTRKEIYNMFVLGLTLDNVLELDINFTNRKDTIAFCKLVNEVYEYAYLPTVPRGTSQFNTQTK